MEIIPAIDIMQGECVRLIRGNYETAKVYSDDPVQTARRFQEAGIKKIHVVDLDGAKKGKVQNWRTLEALAKATSLVLQAGGGFHTKEDIQRLFALGSLHQVSLGTLPLREPQRFKELLSEFGSGRIAADMAFKDGKVFSAGWQVKEQKEPLSFLLELRSLGAREIICTDIARDGTLEGPNLEFYRSAVRQFPTVSLIASGGVRTIEDLRSLSSVGVAGVIVGKALYENTITLQNLQVFL